MAPGSPATADRAATRRRRRRGAVVVLSASILLSGVPLAATASAEPAHSFSASAASWTTVTLPNAVIVPGREIGLQGTDNTRLLAGYRGWHGKTVNAGVLRSDNLSKLTPADQRQLAKRNVKVVVDLRTGVERAVQPDRPVPGARWMSADVLSAVPPTALIDLPQAYVAFVTDRHARYEIRRTLLTIKDTTAKGGTVLFHCTAGKDRTGWVAVSLLNILGVDRATIDADYLASNRYRHARPNDPLNGVNMNLLNASYRAVRQHYGSFDGYLRRGLRLSQADIDSLRATLLS
ncbi:MAG: tyrosine-protein phosphatase [Gordonia sp. (in: high G+C Gram-positive bacteria)]